jgi:hypothetical protein
MHLRRLVLLGAGLAAMAVGSARACPDHAAKTAASIAPNPASARALVAWKPRAWAPAGVSVANGLNGLQVAIDPVDGAYSMPQPDGTPMLRVALDEQPVAVTRRANGSVRAQLDERFADFAVVSLGADGKPRWTCVHGTTQADKFMRAPRPTPDGVGTPAIPPAPGTVWEDK